MTSYIYKITFIGIFFFLAVKLLSCNSSEEPKPKVASNMNTDLIVEYLDSDRLEKEHDDQVDRIQLVKINPEVFNSNFFGEFKTINLNLFRNEEYVANIQKVDSILNGKVKSVYGKITEPNKGYFTLSVEKNKVLGNISLYGSSRKYIRINYSPDLGEHIVIERKSLADIKQDTVITPDFE